MGRSLVDGERSENVKKRVYLPSVDEFKASSGPLSEVVMESLGAVSSSRAKPLKEGYVADLTREGGISPCSVILGLLYIHRLTESNHRYLRTTSGKDLFLTAMMIASKYLNDEGESEALTNSEWAEVGCKSKPALDLMERQFLAAIDWKLYVSLEEYYSFVTGIEARIALNQFAARGWLTYTDMVTVWDAMDSQKAVLSVTKQVAKVTCGSAAVYLVLLSTIFTASHALHSTWTSSSASPPGQPSLTAASTSPDGSPATLSALMDPDVTNQSAPPTHSSLLGQHYHEPFTEGQHLFGVESFGVVSQAGVENPPLTCCPPYHPIEEHRHKRLVLYHSLCSATTGLAELSTPPSSPTGHHCSLHLEPRPGPTDGTTCTAERGGNRDEGTDTDDKFYRLKLFPLPWLDADLGWTDRMLSILNGRGTLPFSHLWPLTDSSQAHRHQNNTDLWRNWSDDINVYIELLKSWILCIDFTEMFGYHEANVSSYHGLKLDGSPRSMADHDWWWGPFSQHWEGSDMALLY